MYASALVPKNCGSLHSALDQRFALKDSAEGQCCISVY